MGELIRTTSRELLWGLRGVSHEAERWHGQASRIADPRIRADALTALHRKRGNINGAALFWTLPQRRDRSLLRALVAYEMLADFLDCVNESDIHLGVRHGEQLQLALQDALDPDAKISDYYLYRPGGDGGYVKELVLTCRRACLRLPSFELMQPYALRAAALSPVLSLNHAPNRAERTDLLRDWARDNLPVSMAPLAGPGLGGGLSWFERTAGASAWLTVLAMLALAGEPRESAPSSADIERVYDTYLYAIAPAGAMLDSYSDIADDLQTGDHSYISYYPTSEAGVARLGQLLRGALDEATALPNGSRHAVLTACMIAFYLSKDSTRGPAMRASTKELRHAGGPLVETLTPVLRAWRMMYGQCAA